MRLLSSCGCDSRREIMFDKGNLGKTEAAILAAAVLTILIAWRLT